MGNNKNHTRKRKRKFCGNQSSSSLSGGGAGAAGVSVTAKKSCSAKKLSEFNIDTEPVLDDFNVIINFSILKDILKEVGNCPECNCGVTVTSDEAKRRGFVHNVEIKCASCQYSYSTYTSGTVDRNTNMTKASTKGRKTFDINLRMIVAFREIGRGHEPLISFSRIANLSCRHVNAFQNNNELIQAAYKSAATDSMKFAGSVIRENAEEKSLTGEKLVQVSLDGTWQKETWPLLPKWCGNCNQ